MAVYLGKDKVAGISTSQPVENNNLKLPEVAPGVQQIVSINSDGTQQNLTLGEGVSIENGTLSASGGGKLYNHAIKLQYTGDYGKHLTSLTIISKNAEIFTRDTLKTFLTDRKVAASGFMWNISVNNRIYHINEVFFNTFTNSFGYNGSHAIINDSTFTLEFDTQQDFTVSTVTDTVYEI